MEAIVDPKVELAPAAPAAEGHLQPSVPEEKPKPACTCDDPYWSNWSGWKWSVEKKRYYCERVDRHGITETMWDRRNPPGSAQNSQRGDVSSVSDGGSTIADSLTDTSSSLGLITKEKEDQIIVKAGCPWRYPFRAVPKVLKLLVWKKSREPADGLDEKGGLPVYHDEATRKSIRFNEKTGLSEVMDVKAPASTTSSWDDQITIDDAGFEDDRYCVEPASKFQPGMIFQTKHSICIHHERSSGKRTIAAVPEVWNASAYGGHIHTNSRRFVVVENKEDHCVCVQITHFCRNECKKVGAKNKKNGIIRRVYWEEQTRTGPGPFPVVACMLDGPGARISSRSRINYSTLVDVEHGVKAFFMGHVIAKDMDVISQAVAGFRK